MKLYFIAKTNVVIGKAQSRITKKVDINAFEACFKQACSNPVDLSALAGSILAPFPEAIAHGTLQSKALGNCIINKGIKATQQKLYRVRHNIQF